MTSLPIVSHATDDRSLRERVAVLIRDYNGGRVEDLAQALADIVTLQSDMTAAQADMTALEADVAALEALAAGSATTFLGANVNLNNTGQFFSGPNTGSIGASGQKWLIIATATLNDTAGAASVELAIFDGSNYIANSSCIIPAVSQRQTMTIQAVVTLSGATTFTLRAKDATSTSGLIQATGNATGVANRATSITAVRLS